MSSPSPHEKDWDTNFGWWIDKPQREARPATRFRTHDANPPRRDRVWAEAALVVGLVLALVLSLISLATRS
ncbi:hypothetical protein ACSFA0_20835 [Variovorax sp. LT1P1]|uniref:hypothetical protein n=1 Tax=Variovorax sp. LT1P1 TaxID=3443730 RepID=UPI003F44D9E6